MDSNGKHGSGADMEICICVLFIKIFIPYFLPEAVFLEPLNFFREHVVPPGLLTPQICPYGFIIMDILLYCLPIPAAIINNG